MRARLPKDLFKLVACLVGSIAALSSISCQPGCGADKEWMTQLFHEVKVGNVPSVETMLSSKKCANAADEDSLTPLMVAASNGRYGVAKVLLERGAEVDKKTKHGTTALMFASSACHPSMVRLFLDSGAYAPMKDYSGESSLDSVQELYTFWAGFDSSSQPQDIEAAWIAGQILVGRNSQWIVPPLPKAACKEVVDLLTTASRSSELAEN